MKRMIGSLLLIGLAACGKRGDLSPPPGASVPVAVWQTPGAPPPATQAAGPVIIRPSRDGDD